MKVIDASVAIKWLISDEIGTEEANNLLQTAELMVAPALLTIEVLSCITRRWRMGETSSADCQESCDVWLQMIEDGDIMLVDQNELLKGALALTFYTKHTLQDCFYMALAKKQNAELVTADITLHKRAKAANIKTQLIGKRH